MAQFAWSPRSEIDRQCTYAVMASRLPLKSYGSIPGFLRDTLSIRRQLRNTAGLVGYALLAELAQKTFWTFSVWNDRQSLDAFASSDPHRRIIRRLAPKMGETVFRFAEVEGSELPWTWQTVKARLQTES